MKEIPITAKVGTGTKSPDGKPVYKTVEGKCKQYSTIAETVKDLGGEDKVLAIVNMHTKIRALDALRKGTSPSLMKMFKSASPDAQEKIKKLLGMA